MNDPSPPGLEHEKLVGRRWFQISIGIALLLFILLCLAGSATLFIDPPDKNRGFAFLVGIVLVFGCLWALAKCVHLITGKKRRGGLMRPRTLRVVAVMFLLLPLSGLFTGYFRDHMFAALVQTAVYISIFFSLRRLARQRESEDSHPPEAQPPVL